MTRYTEQIFYKEKESNNNFNVFDLSCLVIKEKSMKDCNQVLINKLKKNGFYVISSKLNEIKCTKNRMNCQIDIDKIKWDNFNERNVFCYKVNNKKLNRQNSAIIRIKRYDSIRADKNSILDHAKQILDERKEHNPQDVYRKVFTNEEIYMLNE